jgi:hypothetical protein
MGRSQRRRITEYTNMQEVEKKVEGVEGVEEVEGAKADYANI